MKLASITLAAYNAEKYVRDTVKSVLEQSYSNFELIIVNDGSTDGTLDVLSEFSDSRIRVISQENQGLTASRNKGLENSCGYYICFIDADDLLEKNT